MPEMSATSDHSVVALCSGSALIEKGLAVPFEVVYQGELRSAFAVRYQGRAHAYLNRCAHLPLEMDFQPNRFFDSSARWLICSTHAALYEPETGVCVSGPCAGKLVKIDLSETGDMVYWHTSPMIRNVLSDHV